MDTGWGFQIEHALFGIATILTAISGFGAFKQRQSRKKTTAELQNNNDRLTAVNSVIRELKDEVNALKECNSRLLKNNEVLTKSLERLEKDLKSKNKTIGELKAEIEYLVTCLPKKQQEAYKERMKVYNASS